MKSPKTIIQELLAQADIRVNGPRPWDIQVFKPDFYRYVLRDASLGLGESYMAGWWTCPALDELFFKIFRRHLDEQVRIPLMTKLDIVFDYLNNRQSRRKSKKVIEKHYNPSSEIILSFLDRYNQYT